MNFMEKRGKKKTDGEGGGGWLHNWQGMQLKLSAVVVAPIP
jgi:hypothetical protein